MADYSGYRDTYCVKFQPYCSSRNRDRTYWWSRKCFTGAETRVPEPYLGLLHDMFRDFIKRNRKYLEDQWRVRGLPRPQIMFDPVNRDWVMHGFELHWSTEKTEAWMRRNGFEHVVENNIIFTTPEPGLFA